MQSEEGPESARNSHLLGHDGFTHPPLSPPASHDDRSLMEHPLGIQPLINRQAAPSSPLESHGRHQKSCPVRPKLSANASSSSNQSLKIAELGGLASAFLHRQEKVMKSQARVSKVRNRLITERDTFRQDRRWLSHSQESFMKAMDRVVPNAANSAQQMRLRELYEHAHMDQNLLNERVEKLQQIEDRLGGLENSLQKRQEKLAIVANKLWQALSGHAIGFDPCVQCDDVSETSGSVRTSDSAPEEYPALVAAYYEKTSWLKIMMERLANLEVESQEARARRNMREDQELPLEMTDEQFNQEWGDRLARAHQKLQNAQGAYEEAKLACITSYTPYVGEEPTHMPDSDSADGAATHTDITFRQQILVVREPHASFQDEVMPVIESPLRAVHFPPGQPVQDRVKEWIRDIQPSPPTKARRNSIALLEEPALLSPLKVSKNRDDEKLLAHFRDLALRSRESNVHAMRRIVPPRRLSEADIVGRDW